MLERKQPGQIFRPSAAESNQIADAVNWVQAQQIAAGPEVKRGRLEPDVVGAQNGSCEPFSRFEAVELFAPIVQPAEDLNEWCAGRQAFRVGTPESEDGRIAILLESVPPCDQGAAVISGLARARISISDPAHRFAKATPGSRILVSCDDPDAPCEIVWKEEGTGLLYADVLLGKTGQVSAVTSPTTTTASFPESNPCAGFCKWIWNASLGKWVASNSTCGDATTTTASPTTTTGGATTSGPTTTTCCPFPYGAPTTTTSASPTTTTARPCGCLYPTRCGTEDGECVFTDCSTSYNSPPVCGGDSATTTTTCDCGTTTTTAAPAGCEDGCDWVGVPTSGGAWIWSKTFDGCSSLCPCEPPAGDPYCATAHTDCVAAPPTTTTTPEPCSGDCVFWWVPSVSGWVKTDDRCRGGEFGCACEPPSFSGSVCAPASTPCVSPEQPTTTTAAGDPCAGCYENSTTTTTTDPCSAYCKFRWSTALSAWTLIDSRCPDSCPCSEPAFSGRADCEVSWTPCSRNVTTTTTTTTTTAGCAGFSTFVCGDWTDDGSWRWFWQAYNCAGSCESGDCLAAGLGDEWMVAAVSPCDSSTPYATYYWPCSCDPLPTTTTTTTTTAAPTTTTTTTTTTEDCGPLDCSPCSEVMAGGCFCWTGSAWYPCSCGGCGGEPCLTPEQEYSAAWLAAQQYCGNCVSTSCATTTTTTTTDPCSAYCKFRWSTALSAWTIFDYPCPDSCPCSEPAFSGQEDGDVVWTPCSKKVATTTTTGGATTTTTTTTTGDATTTTTTTTTGDATTTTTTTTTTGGATTTTTTTTTGGATTTTTTTTTYHWEA